VADTDDLRDFLMSRRARLRPEGSGLAAFGRNRKVPGLRREEVATLAGISVEYYTKLERGQVAGVSLAVFDGVAGALQLDDAERAYFAALLNLRGPAVGPSRRHGSPIRPSIQRMLDRMDEVAAYVRNARFDILAANRLGAAVYAPLFAQPERPMNSLRYLFLDPAATDFFLDWEVSADQAVSYLRVASALDPHDQGLAEQIRTLTQLSEEFRRRWADHNVRFHHSGIKRFRHPVVGELQLDFDVFVVEADQTLRLYSYTAEPGTVWAERFTQLAAWAENSVDDPTAGG
jgi:transcriptional regulator with XRE-family HTH domain